MGAEPTLPRRGLSVEDYHRIGDAGLFRPLLNPDVAIPLAEVWPAATG